MVIDHIGLRVGDLGRSAAFYDAVLAPLGFRRCYTDDELVGYGPQDAPALWLHAAKSAAAGTHVAFIAPDRDAVAAFHAAGLKAGGGDNGGPGLRPAYTPTYFAAFLVDPDGNNVEAVCNREPG